MEPAHPGSLSEGAEKRSPAPSMRELARPKGVTEGVYYDERSRAKVLESKGAAD